MDHGDSRADLFSHIWIESGLLQRLHREKQGLHILYVKELLALLAAPKHSLLWHLGSPLHDSVSLVSIYWQVFTDNPCMNAFSANEPRTQERTVDCSLTSGPLTWNLDWCLFWPGYIMPWARANWEVRLERRFAGDRHVLLSDIGTILNGRFFPTCQRLLRPAENHPAQLLHRFGWVILWLGLCSHKPRTLT